MPPDPTPDPRTDLPRVRRSAFVDLDPGTLYDILRLRVDVFVVEQACAFGDLDGRDLEPDASHLWVEDDEGRVVAYARILSDPVDPEGPTQIGRIVTHPDARGTGLGAHLLRDAMASIDGPIVLKAQARLADWYGHFGFEIVGPEFLEDHIPHVPMRRD